MGDKGVTEKAGAEEHRAFMKALLADVRALELMLERGMFERGQRRIGAEQEMFLVNEELRPAPAAMQVLDAVGDDRLTTELALFNLEANCLPRTFQGDCLRQMEEELREVVTVAAEGAQKCGSNVVLTGILPTLRRADLTLDNMTPIERYRELNEALLASRGGDFTIHIKGIDELHASHDNVMYEACNTSFQIHFQVGPEEFARLYNVAQLVTAPVLACAVNSPLFLGSRLWHETRVALFGSSIDDRNRSARARGIRPRVTFGDDWVQDSVLEIFREQIARFRVVIAAPPEGDPLQEVEAGRAPSLRALRLHNGTVYRWNRACYGVSPEGVAQLRIENRVLPAGPTVLDEVANAAFFFGLMVALTDQVGDPKDHLPFADAKDNFAAAARHGLKAQCTWVDGETYAAAELIEKTLLPAAREGLTAAGIDAEDRDRYLGVIADRVRSGRTGSRWALESLTQMNGAATSDIRQSRLVAEMLERQRGAEPVHRWPLAELQDRDPDDELRRGYRVVEQFMSTDLFTVRATDLVDLAASVMEWEHIKHVPVEDEEGRLIGLVTHRCLLRLVARGYSPGDGVLVKDIMVAIPLAVPPDTKTLDAMRLMREKNISCLPVVEDDMRLVGIITEADLIAVSSRLLEKFLED